MDRTLSELRIWLFWDRKERVLEAVLHPALPTYPGHHLWKRDFTGSSGLFSIVFRLPLSDEELHDSMDRLKLFKIGYSWGGVASLVVTVDPKEAPNARVYAGRLLRFYVGLEDPVDLIADIEQAFRI